MPIRKKGNIEIQTNPNGSGIKRTGYTFYSYDKNSAALYFEFNDQNGQPTDLKKATVRLVMILNDDDRKNASVTTKAEIISGLQGTAKYDIPESLLSYEGKVTGYVYLEFEDGSHADEGQFTFNIKRSMISNVLPKAGDKYVQDFEDVKERVEQAADDTIKAANQAQGDIQTSVSDVQSRQAGAEKDIAGLVESTESARDEAVKTMNELDYNDRNLIVESKLRPYDGHSTQPVVEENGRKITVTYKEHENQIISLKVEGWTIPKGKYTLSARIEINGEPVTQETFLSKKAHSKHHTSANERFDVLSDGTLIATERYDTNPYNYILHTPFDGLSEGDEIVFYDLQFQPGSVATPWQPAFGNYDAKIKKLEEAIINLGGSI